MSKNNVRVTVNLIDNFSGTLERLERRLDKISKKTITPEFHIKGTKDIENLKLRMETIDDVIETMLQIFGDRKITETKAKIESLSGVENVYVRTHDHELTQTIAKMKALRSKRQIQNRQAVQDDFLGNISRATTRARRVEGSAAKPTRTFDLGDTSVLAAATRERRRQEVRNRNLAASIIPNDLFENIMSRRGSRGGGGGGPGIPRPGGGRGGDDDDRSIFRRIGKGAHKWLIPKGQLSQDLFAFMMPFMATFYTAMMGMIATMGATAAAGLSVGLLGIIGFGENAADSLHLAQVRLRLFGRELFKVFKPVTKTFAPVMDAFFRQAPHALGRLTGSFQQLMVFVPALRRHGQGIISWIDALILKTVQLQPQISQLTSRFGELTGQKLLDFFGWLVDELYENQTAIINVLSVGKSLLILIYRIFLLWGFLFSVLQPVADILRRIADLLTNKWVAGIVAFLIVFTVFIAAMTKALALMAIMKTMGLGAAFVAMIAPILQATGAMYAYAAALVGAAKAKALLMGLTGVGAVLAIAGAAAAMSAVEGFTSGIDTGGHGGGAGFSGGGGGFGGAPAGAAGGTTVINIQGDVGKDEYNKMRDDFPGLYRQEADYDVGTKRPTF